MDLVGWPDIMRSALRFLGKARGTHHLAREVPRHLLDRGLFVSQREVNHR